MGREIRRVPKGWEHPRTKHGDHQPLFDEDFEAAAARWKANFLAWEAGTHESLIEEPGRQAEMEYWEWNGNPPDREYYRPKWTEEPTCCQVYETVTEGTPDSPVFETKEALRDWLVSEGHSEHAANRFVEEGWAPSAFMTSHPNGNLVSGIGINAWDVLK